MESTKETIPKSDLEKSASLRRPPSEFGPLKCNYVLKPKIEKMGTHMGADLKRSRSSQVYLASASPRVM